MEDFVRFGTIWEDLGGFGPWRAPGTPPEDPWDASEGRWRAPGGPLQAPWRAPGGPLEGPGRIIKAEVLLTYLEYIHTYIHTYIYVHACAHAAAQRALELVGGRR